MKAISNLPQGYENIYTVNLQKDKKTSLFVNLFSILIGILMVVLMHFIIPVFLLFDMSEGLKNYLIRFAVLFVLAILYLILHELVHGIAMKICGTEKVKYGFAGLYAFAGSDDYYDKRSYIFIALAPIVFLGIVLAVINPFVPTKWFWVVYLIQVFNVSGAAGDFFVTFKFLHFPKDILIKDSGLEMTVYSKSDN